MENYGNLISTFSLHDLFLILISIILGLFIGAEREYHNKTAGLRTLMLVCVGSCIFTILSIKIGGENPDRIAANIITGIGFLGAGAIFKDENKINGLTTACTIWITAAIGMCVGSDNFFLGIIGTITVIFVLWILIFLEKFIDGINRSVIYKITFEYNEENLNHLKNIFSKFGMKVSKIYQSKIGNEITLHWRLSGKREKHKELAKLLLSDNVIKHIEF